MRWQLIIVLISISRLIDPSLGNDADVYEDGDDDYKQPDDDDDDDDALECDYDRDDCDHICSLVDGKAKCSCNEGFYLDETDGKTCLDKMNAKETSLNNDNIKHNISCPDGFDLDEDESICIDIDECEDAENYSEDDDPDDDDFYDDVNNGKSRRRRNPDDEQHSLNRLCSHICVNTNGSYHCSCPEKMILNPDAKTCSFEDPCSLLNCTESCHKINETYQCIPQQCPSGYFLNNDTCDDIDECLTPDKCSDICINTPGNYSCSCHSGFELIEDGHTCKDIDECTQDNIKCSHSCINTPGSYNCGCFPGFELDQDLIHCIDKDDCALANCSDTCIDGNSTFTCICPEGNHLMDDGLICADIDECKNQTLCQFDCENTIGGYICICEDGFDLSDDDYSCVDRDECQSENKCQHICNNTEGSYACSCLSGYRLDLDNATCIDVDECQEIEHGCSHDCNNTIGSYECVCPSGFISSANDSSICEDIDECHEGHGCSHNCVNTFGSYGCSCNPGFILSQDGFACKDLDECAIGNSGCLGICENFDGGFRCIDPCQIDNGGCSHICKSVDNRTVCDCPDGFKIGSNASLCVDVDECEETNAIGCQHQCLNTIGSYMCKCNEGYLEDNGSCLDVNECDSVEDACGKNMECVNTQGSFQCSCKSGFSRRIDGDACEAMNKSCSAMTSPLHGSMKCSFDDSEFVSGTSCNFWCETGYKLIGSTIRHCNISGLWEGEESQCIPQPCPRLDKPENGHFIPSTCTTGKTFPSEFCTLICNNGFKPKSARMLTCTENSSWKPNNMPVTCVSAKRITLRPFIRCPANIFIKLKSTERDAKVIIPRPLSNMDWFRYIDAEPTWAKSLRHRLKPGVTEVIFKARNPKNNTADSCKMTITVSEPESEKPKVLFCPKSFDVILRRGEYSRSIVWEEPQFTDNVNVQNIHRSKIPGCYMGVGIHHIDYIGIDNHGNKAYCHFTINVVEFKKNPGEFHLREGVLICPGRMSRRINPSNLIYIPRGCNVYWLKSKNHFDDNNYIQNDEKNHKDFKHLQHYDGWNLKKLNTMRRF